MRRVFSLGSKQQEILCFFFSFSLLTIFATIVGNGPRRAERPELQKKVGPGLGQRRQEQDAMNRTRGENSGLPGEFQRHSIPGVCNIAGGHCLLRRKQRHAGNVCSQFADIWKTYHEEAAGELGRVGTLAG